MEAIIAITYRCNARCYMCHTWRYPSKRTEEITPAELERLPRVKFANITGGEPLLREDIEDVVSVVRRKANRVVISTNGYFTERIIELGRKFPDVGVRVSLEGLPAANDELRGIKDGFDRGLRTIIELQHIGIKDIGFGITVSDRNAKDLLALYRLAREMRVEFATAIVHNSYYFHKFDNVIQEKDMVLGEFERLIAEMLRSGRIKNWFRAYFNYGIINYIYGGKRLLPCEQGTRGFMVDPLGEIHACNVMEDSMGNIKEKPFEEIWNSSEAQAIRRKVAVCDKRCWMIGSVTPVMTKNILIPIRWILKNRFRYVKLARRSECV
jgi:MoaA/NifB/PqqE/SkfB family radical SAM enzyme